jgi:hypothetical protein
MTVSGFFYGNLAKTRMKVEYQTRRKSQRAGGARPPRNSICQHHREADEPAPWARLGGPDRLPRRGGGGRACGGRATSRARPGRAQPLRGRSDPSSRTARGHPPDPGCHGAAAPIGGRVDRDCEPRFASRRRDGTARGSGKWMEANLRSRAPRSAGGASSSRALCGGAHRRRTSRAREAMRQSEMRPLFLRRLPFSPATLVFDGGMRQPDEGCRSCPAPAEPISGPN